MPDPARSPKATDMTLQEADFALKGVYSVEDDTLKLCWGLERPTGFEAKKGFAFFTARREKR